MVGGIAKTASKVMNEIESDSLKSNNRMGRGCVSSMRCGCVECTARMVCTYGLYARSVRMCECTSRTSREIGWIDGPVM